MESLRSYFAYNKDYDELPALFYSVSKALKSLHDKRKCVGFLSSDNILLEDGVVDFSDVVDFQDEKKSENLRSLSKIILGSYVSLSSGYRDFSSVDDEWIKNNFYGIQGMLQMTTLPAEFLERSLLSGVSEYYHNYSDLEKDMGISSSKAITKSLRKASYSLANESIGENVYERKSAFASTLIYPTIIVALIILIIIFILINNV